MFVSVSRFVCCCRFYCGSFLRFFGVVSVSRVQYVVVFIGVISTFFFGCRFSESCFQFVVVVFIAGRFLGVVSVSRVQVVVVVSIAVHFYVLFGGLCRSQSKLEGRRRGRCGRGLLVGSWVLSWS